MEKFQEFILFLTSTVLYAELNLQYTPYEIVEVNAGKFEISEVQTAYQRYLKDTSVQQKRGHFVKDLDKLVSGDYVLVPKQPTEAMIEAAHLIFEQTSCGPIGTYKAMLEVVSNEN